MARTSPANRSTTEQSAKRTVVGQKKTDETKGDAAPRVSHEQIAMRAYEIYLSRGAAGGSEVEDWLQAERELAERS